MKRIIYLFLLAVSAFCWTACEDHKGPEGETETSDYYEFPLNIQKGSYKAGSNGVSVNVTELAEQNIIFEAKPGNAVNSYRVDVYPKALLYNFLLEEGCYEGTADECEDKIIELMMSSTTGASQTVFNMDSDDFEAKEFSTSFDHVIETPDIVLKKYCEMNEK